MIEDAMPTSYNKPLLYYNRSQTRFKHSCKLHRHFTIPNAKYGNIIPIFLFFRQYNLSIIIFY